MSDKLLDFLTSSFIMILLIIAFGLSMLLTFSNLSLIIDFIKHW
jgi:hypothetical protein